MTTMKVPSRLAGSTVLVLPDCFGDGCELDAGNLAFIQPSGLVQLVLALNFLARQGVPVLFIAPSFLAISVPACNNRLKPLLQAGLLTSVWITPRTGGQEFLYRAVLPLTARREEVA